MAAGIQTGALVWTVATGLNQPDDLLYDGGSLYVGELGAGVIDVLSPGRAARRLPQRVPKPEGMAFLGSTLYAGDQAADRVVALDSTGPRTVIQLRPVAGQDGVDGISAAGGLLIVPDSPRGVVDWVTPAGQIVRQAGGFVRPTGAWPEPDGSVLIADEYGNSVVSVSASGARAYVARGVPIADDVVADPAGAVFVVEPLAAGGRLVQIEGGAAVAIATGLAEPQGLALDGAGNVYFSESGRGRVDLLVRTFKLLPAATAGGLVCVDLGRAPGFTAPVVLAGGPGVEVVRQPGAGTRGAVRLGACPATGCQVTATAGTLTDRMWVG